MTTPIVIVGAGGFGRETIDVVDAMNHAGSSDVYELLGVVDAAPSSENLSRLAARGIRWLGTESAWLQSKPRARFVIGVGSPTARARIDQTFRAVGLSAATVVHPNAGIGSLASIGVGSVVCSGVQISTNVSLGQHVHINPNATIGHDSVLHDFVSINPAAVVSGNVTVQSGVLIGAGAVVLQGLQIGAGATIGASACVVRDVGAQTVVKGVPAR